MITRLIAFARGLLRRRQIDDEIAEELRDHLEREIELHRSRGVSLDEARRMALRDLGGLTQTIEATRDVRETWFGSVTCGIRFAARVLLRSRRFTAAALALILGLDPRRRSLPSPTAVTRSPAAVSECRPTRLRGREGRRRRCVAEL
jgi:hypothetical protein